MKQSFRKQSALHHLGILGKELKAGTWKQKLKPGPWSRGSQPVGQPIWRLNNSFTGVARDHRKAQIFPLWPTTVTKLQLRSCSENNFISGGHHNTRNCVRKVENTALEEHGLLLACLTCFLMEPGPQAWHCPPPWVLSYQPSIKKRPHRHLYTGEVFSW